jgi:hypothetical protein
MSDRIYCQFTILHFLHWGLIEGRLLSPLLSKKEKGHTFRRKYLTAIGSQAAVFLPFLLETKLFIPSIAPNSHTGRIHSC